MDRWDVSRGPGIAEVDQLDGSLRVSGRTKSTQGPRVRLYPPLPSGADADPCGQVQADAPYLCAPGSGSRPWEGTARAPARPAASACTCSCRRSGGTARVDLSLHWPTANDEEYFDFRAVIHLTQAELDDVNNYSGALYLLFLGVPAPGYDVGVSKMELVAAPAPAYPDAAKVSTLLLENQLMSLPG